MDSNSIDFELLRLPVPAPGCRFYPPFQFLLDTLLEAILYNAPRARCSPLLPSRRSALLMRCFNVVVLSRYSAIADRLVMLPRSSAEVARSKLAWRAGSSSMNPARALRWCPHAWHFSFIRLDNEYWSSIVLCMHRFCGSVLLRELLYKDKMRGNLRVCPLLFYRMKTACSNSSAKPYGNIFVTYIKFFSGSW